VQRWHSIKERNQFYNAESAIRHFATASSKPALSFSLRNAHLAFPHTLWPSLSIYAHFSTAPHSETSEDAFYDGEDPSTQHLNFPQNPENNFASRNRFEDLDLHPKTLKALRRQGLHRLTEIQQQTFDLIYSGHNVVARSRTGTGKTLAFLVPSLERLLKQQQQNLELDKAQTNFGIQLLIIAPTRELALQIHQEAEKLLHFHQKSNPTLTSQVLYGGSSKEMDIRQFQKALPTILVATPGRLKDHLATTTLSYTSKDDGTNDETSTTTTTTTTHVPFRKCLQSLQILVLDETDRLLEMGFRRDITDILSAIPAAKDDRQRQTLLFSATLPEDVLDVVDLAMPQKAKTKSSGDLNPASSNYQLIDCIQEADPTTHTNENTIQSHMILPADRFWTGSMEYILELLEGGTQKQNKQRHTKIIVFFPMTRLVQVFYKFFTERLGHGKVWELHGKMHQRDRTVVARRFRNTPSGVLFTSDVSARGVDYPDVTHVVQVGAAPSRETYIHRLGRCGRAGKPGEGMLILPEMEQGFLQELDGLNRDAHDNDSTVKHFLKNTNRELENELGLLRQDMRQGQDDSEMKRTLHLAYHAMISYYFQTCRDTQQSPEQVVATVNQLVLDFGLSELPPIDFERAKKMEIDGLAGLNIRKSWEDTGWSQVRGHDDEFHRKPYGEFDDWFDMKSHRQTPQNEKGTSTRDGSTTSTRVHPKRDLEHEPNKVGSFQKSASRRRQSQRLDKFQRWDFPGEFQGTQ
jgi:ATP-dependent RNA helicase MSS116, mitochondrial